MQTPAVSRHFLPSWSTRLSHIGLPQAAVLLHELDVVTVVEEEATCNHHGYFQPGPFNVKQNDLFLLNTTLRKTLANCFRYVVLSRDISKG